MIYIINEKGGGTVLSKNKRRKKHQNKKEKIYPIKPVPTATEKIKEITVDVPKAVSCVPWSVIVTNLIFAIITVAIAVFMISQLFCEYNYKYSTHDLPPKAQNDSELQKIESIDEADAPPIPREPVIYDFASAVPESAAVDYDYFDDTVFIGDSRTKGLITYSKLSPYDFSSVGLNVGLLLTQPFIRLPDDDGELQSYTLLEALEREDVNYKAIYIATGLNELGWPADGFIAAFSDLIDALREVTDVPIYVQLIIPVTTYSSETTKFGITNEKNVIFNERLITLAKEKELFLLDPRELFTLEDGTLDPAHSSDGVHLNRDSCAILADYYRTHVVDLYEYDNTRPQE
ncbi:MAG: hypothetical protein IJY93_02635 [Clostridia bacterium]|nr:hypothetical protein [Clostridia bacterium]